MRGAAALLGMVLCSTLLYADDHRIDFDLHVDFSKIKTFSIRDGNVDSTKPELNNALVRMNIKDTIRTALLFSGLKETPDHPNMIVEFSVSYVEYSIGPSGIPRPISPERGGQRGTSDPRSTDPVEFLEGTLVIDMTADGPGNLIWRGVYRDNEKNTVKFSAKLISDARKLMSEYPPKPKK